MARVVYWICLCVMALWTGVSLFGAVQLAYELQPTIQKLSLQMGMRAEVIWITFVFVTSVVTWSMVIIPVGICAILAKPAWPISQEAVEEISATGGVPRDINEPAFRPRG